MSDIFLKRWNRRVHFFRLRGKELLEQEFFLVFVFSFRSNANSTRVSRWGSGWHKPEICEWYIYSHTLSFCSTTHLRRVQRKMAEVEKLSIGIEKRLNTINALTQAILGKAFRGELS